MEDQTAPPELPSPVEPPRRSILRLALVVEVALGVFAVAISLPLGHWPLPGVSFRAPDWASLGMGAAWGLAGAVPMIAMLLVIDRWPIGPLEDLKRFVSELVVPLFAPLNLLQLALISALAGIGEEMLFRGVLQDLLAQRIGGTGGLVVGLLAGSVVFGVCHWLTPTYAALATLIGLYMGVLLVVSGSILAPIVAHAAYDFVALWYLVKRRGARTT